MSTKPPLGFRPDDYPNWADRLRDGMSPVQRRIVTSAGILVMLAAWGLFLGTALRLPGDTWQDAFTIPILFAIAMVGFRWAPARSTPPSQTLRARRTRAWVGLPVLFGGPGLLIWSVEVFGGFPTAMFAAVLGILIDRWALWDIKLTDLFSDSERQPDAAALVARHSEWDRQDRRVTDGVESEHP
ncbi:MAG TPA: hypothetical protein VNP20_07455 [Nocardioidaceae bacterium]|nr:hypothetical protein [Nocardioidaceae bacterium]